MLRWGIELVRLTCHVNSVTRWVPSTPLFLDTFAWVPRAIQCSYLRNLVYSRLNRYLILILTKIWPVGQVVLRDFNYLTHFQGTFRVFSGFTASNIDTVDILTMIVTCELVDWAIRYNPASASIERWAYNPISMRWWWWNYDPACIDLIFVDMDIRWLINYRSGPLTGGMQMHLSLRAALQR